MLLALSLQGCVSYEYEHEFWLAVDGSGSVTVTAPPSLWLAFKGVGRADDPGATKDAARALFESSGLKVRRASVTRRDGRFYVSVRADFDDVNRLSASPAFRDLAIELRPQGDRLILAGSWRKPAGTPASAERAGAMAVRFHLPSKVYTHQNAALGVERGNIVSWRQEVARALAGGVLAFGATLDRRSILGSTVRLFVFAIALALLLMGGALMLVVRWGRRGAG